MSGVFWDQAPYVARFEWGLAGVERLAPSAEVVIIVDVLSFTTCIDLVVEQGGTVYPLRADDVAARELAQRRNASMAAHRDQTTPEQPYSLSPASLQNLPSDVRIVLPSPIGATLSVAAATFAAPTLAGCLRNARAVAEAARETGSTATVIAAGERWPVDAMSLRPSFEDLVGAGAILEAFEPDLPSPEAVSAIAAFRAVADSLPRYLAACSSGRELISKGFAGDVEITARLNVSSAVPRLEHGAYTPLKLGA